MMGPMLALLMIDKAHCREPGGGVRLGLGFMGDPGPG